MDFLKMHILFMNNNFLREIHHFSLVSVLGVHFSAKIPLEKEYAIN